MYVSEGTFVHLQQAADEQLNRELEYRRIAQEREPETAEAHSHGLRNVIERLRHTEQPAAPRLLHS
ncbi:MAG: hypothetical protein ABWY37_04890 [Microbacterium pygmaeum]